jgi:dCMP deaminase
MLSDKNFINIAKEIASASKCVSKSVGAVIVKDGRILSTGYNGTPPGYINCNDYWDDKYTKEHHDWSKTYEIHAEMNAIIWAARKGISIEGATIYVTLEPCSECSKNLIASGISRIVYETKYEYNNSETISKFLQDNGVKIEQINTAD